MYANRKRLGELLVSQKLITQEQLDTALDMQRRRFQPLGHILIQQNWITEKRLLQTCAFQKGVSAWYLQDSPATAEAIALIPPALCKKHQVLPVQINGPTLILAMRDPGDVDGIDAVRNLSKLRVEPVLANEERLLEAIQALDQQGGGAPNELSRLVSEAMTEFEGDSMNRASGEVTEAEMRPVVGLVNKLLTEAIRMRASDIHIEHRKEHVEVRFRVDGQLQRVHTIPGKLKAALVARVKIMALLDIVEHRLPQDGRLSVTLDGRTVDLRISVLPNYHGERIVMRVLDKNAVLRRLPDLGFSETNNALFEEMIVKPHGLVLVTGPTGSGKTTTLYAALNHLKEVTNNIMTCEDPVEYDIDGLNQSQVNEKVGLTFAAQLRAILRQDPDIVLVGEIRDQETAEIALRASMTGHLVLSTLHCNDAVSAVPRLMDMGVDPSLLSTALIGVTAQRLVRVLCENCKEQYASTPEERLLFGPQLQRDHLLLWKAVGCAECGDMGYKGRMAVHEVFPVTSEVQRAISIGEPVEALRRKSALYGYVPMQAAACDAVLAGLTSLTEARRLVFFDTSVPAAEPAPLLHVA